MASEMIQETFSLFTAPFPFPHLNRNYLNRNIHIIRVNIYNIIFNTLSIMHMNNHLFICMFTIFNGMVVLYGALE